MTSRTFARFGVRAIALAAVAVALPACATITRGSNQDFTVESTPPGARVSTSNGFQCDSTPCTFRMPRKNGFRVTVSREGYVSQEVEVTSGVSGGGAAGMAGNVVFGGVIGAVVDGTSGAMKDLSPNPLVVVLLTPAEQRAADAERARAAAAAAAAPAASQ
jgi:hypothetical protein